MAIPNEGMDGVLYYDSALYSYILSLGQSWTNKMNFGMDHMPQAQNRSVVLVTCSPVRYHWTAADPCYIEWLVVI